MATLAALAALGRVAFAPLPNVKPTSDIVLLSGFALGGAPGFAVGAIAALASNLVFGQGPWTPWQMAAWGLVGVLGAALGAASGRRLGRVPLAAACGAAGLLYGAILDYSTWVTFSGVHTLGGYLAFSATSLSFNLAHAIGNVVFCLAFGPAFVRALLRFRARFEVRWEPVAAAALGGSWRSSASRRRRAPRRRPPTCAPRRTATAASAAPRGRPPRRSTRRGRRWAWRPTAVATRAWRATWPPAPSRVSDVGDIERTILGLVAQGASPRRAHGTDLVARLLRARRRDGSWDGLVNRTAFAILALRAAAAGDRQVRAAVRWLGREPNRDGGFSFARRGSPSGIDDTAGAVQALAAAGHRRGPTVRRAWASSSRARTPTAASPCSPVAPRTRSRPPGPSRRWWPAAAIPAACAAAARGPRCSTCGR